MCDVSKKVVVKQFRTLSKDDRCQSKFSCILCYSLSLGPISAEKLQSCFSLIKRLRVFITYYVWFTELLFQSKNKLVGPGYLAQPTLDVTRSFKSFKSSFFRVKKKHIFVSFRRLTILLFYYYTFKKNAFSDVKNHQFY